MYLLAIWCEPQTHPLLIKFLRLPGEQAIDLSGDIVTQDMFWMLVQNVRWKYRSDRSAGG